MRYVRPSVWRLVYISTFFIVVLNGVAIWKFINQKDCSKKQINDPVSTGRASEVSENVAKTSKTAKSLKSRLFDTKSFYNREYLVEDTFGTIARPELIFRSRTLLEASNNSQLANYPPDVFTPEQKRSGYIVFHVLGVCYMFLGLAIICDDFFVPSLHIISKVINISDDVAGATFMAAGGSAPELFVSIIGVFISKSNVGFGTIVGSAVFNVLFVIGMCAMFSKAILSLTWWPLLRDSIFYIIALIVLIVFFSDQKIDWYEALVLLIIYVLYVIFMAYNGKTERVVKDFLATNATRCFASVTPMQLKAGSLSSSDLKRDIYSNGPIQLAVHTLDPIAEDPVDEKYRRMRQQSTATPSSNANYGSQQFDGPCDCGRCSTCSSIIGASSPRSPILAKNAKDAAKTSTSSIEKEGEEETKFQDEVQVDLNNTHMHTQYNNSHMVYGDGNAKDLQGDNLCKDNDNLNSKKHHESFTSPYSATDIDLNNLQDTNSNEIHSDKTKNFGSGVNAMRNTNTSRQFSRQSGRNSSRSRSSCHSHRGLFIPAQNTEEPECEEIVDNNEEEEEEGPVDFSFPDSCGARLYYVIKLPLLVLFSITVPDVRRQKLWKLFPLTFIMSIVWIAALSYLMAWWATEIGVTAGIPDEVMGLTFLAAGTSIPDLITSVVVARQGHGDMAVSSSIGSNIFDVTVGLPFPWLLKSLINARQPVTVESDGLFCSTLLLFLMLLAICIAIAASKWKMTKFLGGVMFFLYVIFIAITLLIQFGVFTCPVI